jgi:hypothetical protein
MIPLPSSDIEVLNDLKETLMMMEFDALEGLSEGQIRWLVYNAYMQAEKDPEKAMTLIMSQLSDLDSDSDST